MSTTALIYCREIILHSNRNFCRIPAVRHRAFSCPRFLYRSVFLHGTRTQPQRDFICFILPIKVKWLAWSSGVIALLELLLKVTGGGSGVSTHSNFLLFFAMNSCFRRNLRPAAEKHRENEGTGRGTVYVCTQYAAQQMKPSGTQLSLKKWKVTRSDCATPAGIE